MGQKTYYEPDRGEQPAPSYQQSQRVKDRAREIYSQRATSSRRDHRGSSEKTPDLTRKDKQAMREKEQDENDYLRWQIMRNETIRSYRPISRDKGHTSTSERFFNLWFDNNALTKQRQETLKLIAPLLAGTVIFELDHVWTCEAKRTEKARAELARGHANSILGTDELSCLVRNQIATPNILYSATDRNYLNQYLRSVIHGGAGRGGKSNGGSERGQMLWSLFKEALGARTGGSAQYDYSAPPVADNSQTECYTYAQTASFDPYGQTWQTGSLSRNATSW